LSTTRDMSNALPMLCCYIGQ